MSGIESYLEPKASRRMFFTKLYVVLAGMALGFGEMFSFFTGSKYILSLVLFSVLMREDEATEDSVFDKWFWGLSGIAFSFVIAGLLNPVSVVWMTLGYLYWPRFVNIKSSNLNRLLVVASVFVAMAASLAFQAALSRFFSIPFNSMDAPLLGVVWGMLARVFADTFGHGKLHKSL